jgi:hypothetical protein
LPSVSKNGMFHNMRNTQNFETANREKTLYTEQELLQALLTILKKRFPAIWEISLEPKRVLDRFEVDAVLTIHAPDGVTGCILIEAKNANSVNINNWLVRQSQLSDEKRFPASQWLLVAPYVSPMMRERLKRVGVSYVDMTGNLYVICNHPAVFLMQEGASTNPWREEHVLHSLKGRGASRAIRALCDFRPPYGIRELAMRSNTPAPTITRVVQLLEQEDLLQRDSAGKIIDVQWRQVLVRWTQDYNFITSHHTKTFLEPRGLDALLRKLQKTDRPYAVTGSLATLPLGAIAPPRLAALYVPNSAQAAEHLHLHRADHGANVLLVEPFDPVVFERTVQVNGIVYAAATQVAADLLTSSGRGPEEAEWILEWMEEHENVWRA